jgi:hypothetical protein
MSNTAVGLFKDKGAADQVVSDLDARAFPSSQIRLVSEPLDLGTTGMLDSPRTHFEVVLARDLMAIGATVTEANLYAQGVRQGGVLIFATGSSDEVAAAGQIMNQRGAVQTEEFLKSEPETAFLVDAGTTAMPETETQIGRVRSAGSGARVFVW